MKRDNSKTITCKKKQITELIFQFHADLKTRGIECKYRFVNITIAKRKITCLVLWFESADNLEKNNIKEYSFVVAKGKRDKIIINQHVVDQLERVLTNKLQYIKRKPKASTCKNNFFDYLKYLFCYKYSYKKEILGIDINIIRLVIVVISGVIFAVLSFRIRHSYYLEYGHYPLW